MRPPEDARLAATETGTALPVASSTTVRAYVRELLGRHRRAFAVVVSLHAVAAAAGLVGPWILGNLVQGLTQGTAAAIVDRSALVFLAALVVQTVFTRTSRLRAGVLGEEVLADLREDFLDPHRRTASGRDRARRDRGPRDAYDNRRRPALARDPRRRPRADDRTCHRRVRRRRTADHSA